MSSSESDKFFLDVTKTLGVEFDAYCNCLRALALSKPAEYFTMKEAVVKSVKADAIKNLYKTLFNVMSLGTDFQGNSINKLGTVGFQPHYPSQLINTICLSAASDLNDHLNKVLDIILPDDFEKLADRRIEIKGKGSIVDMPSMTAP